MVAYRYIKSMFMLFTDMVYTVNVKLMQMLEDASLKESTLWKQIIKMCLLICFFNIFKKYLLNSSNCLSNICII